MSDSEFNIHLSKLRSLLVIQDAKYPPGLRNAINDTIEQAVRAKQIFSEIDRILANDFIMDIKEELNASHMPDIQGADMVRCNKIRKVLAEYWRDQHIRGAKLLKDKENDK